MVASFKGTSMFGLFAKAMFCLLIVTLPQILYSSERTKIVSIDMKWQLGGIKQVDKISLHFQKGSVDCSLNFFQSDEFANYIQSFGPQPIPVIFNVSYREDGQPLGAVLVKVGNWDASKLQPNERLLSTTQKLEPGRAHANTLKLNSPAGCFDPIAQR
jgi:hypothetical protein